MDRIDDAYNGLMGDAFMRKTRERMHWICSQVDGSKVLDVGCSQGTLARLLGSVGKEVCALDINKDAIEYAVGKLAESDGSLRDRVSYTAVNFMDFKSECRFDTVVMGEVLEHLATPEAFVGKAHELLVKNGRLVVTVPFGINDDPDHRQTFYWSWIGEIIAPYFEIKEVKFFGKWVGVTAARRDRKSAVEKAVPFSAVKELEAAFYAVERPLVNDNRARGDRLQTQQKTLTEMKAGLIAKTNDIQKAVKDGEAQRLRADKAVADYAKLKTDLSAEVAKQKDALAKVTSEKTALEAEQTKVKDLSAKLFSARNELATAKNEALELRVNLDAGRKVSEGQIEQIAVLKTALQVADKSCKTSESRIDALSAELSEVSSLLTVERKKTSDLSALLGQTKALCEAEKKKSAEAIAALARANDSLAAAKKKAAEEDAQLKSKITQLTSQNRELSNQKRQVERALNIEKKAHDKLAKSKLGRLTLKYWNWKDGRKRIKNPQQKSDQPNAKQINELTVGNHEQQTAVDEFPKGDETFFERMQKKLVGMPESNGCRYYEKINARIGIICDQFYYDSIFSSADFVYISPDASESQLAGLDCMLVVSAWRGLKDDEWKGISTEGRPRRIAAEKIIEICHKNNVPTVFYSKEDPPNYDLYVGLAQKCDYVFTSAAECVPDYKRDCGHDRVYVMEFCINPEMHNPVGMRHAEKERNVIFSGSWMEKYPHRCHDLGIIFDGILKSGRELNIVDRNYELRGNPMYRYPEKYRKYQSPAIDHADLLKVHKLFDWAVNINSVKDSSTMFANRVYELQAAGNLLLSNYSVGVSNLLPTVFLVHDSEEAARMLSAFTDDELYERQISGVRRVMTGETCYDRVGRMLDTIGVRKIKSFNRRVMVVADKITDRIRTMFDRQSLAEKELFAISDVTEALYEQADIVAFFQEDVDYGVFYLEDMVNAFKYTDCDYITKEAYLKRGKYVKGREHCYVDRIISKYRTVFWRDSFEWKTLKKMHGKVKLVNGYSIDRFNYTEGAVRRKTVNPDVSVIIPTYNNGWFLYGRSFASLRRSSLFDKMEIIIVDDGSSDGFTPKMGEYLASLYGNVHTYRFQMGGSGTPSRPRNKGVDIAKGRFVAFLNPECEAVGDSYASMYSPCKGGECFDLVLSDFVRFSDQCECERYSRLLENSFPAGVSMDGRSALVLSKFPRMEIQTMLINRSFLSKGKFYHLDKGVEADVLLCQEMMLAASKMCMSPSISVVCYEKRLQLGDITPVFFEGCYIMELNRSKWLKHSGLHDVYAMDYFSSSGIDFYIEKLRYVTEVQRAVCCRKLSTIISLYKVDGTDYAPRIQLFLNAVEKNEFEECFIGLSSGIRNVEGGGGLSIIMEIAEKLVLQKGKRKCWYSCAIPSACKVNVSGSMYCPDCLYTDKAVLMCVDFRDKDGNNIKSGSLPVSAKHGEYEYIVGNGGDVKSFKFAFNAPIGAVTLRIGFMYWHAKGVVDLSKIRITSRADKKDVFAFPIFNSGETSTSLMENKCKSPSVSVIVPTYKENPYIWKTVDSLLNQDYSGDLCIYLCVNGGNKRWYKTLVEKFRDNGCVRVLLTLKKGANAGRNIGLDTVETSLVMFVDDDDYLTSGCIRTLAECFNDPTVNVSVVRSEDHDIETGFINKDTNINKFLRKVGPGRCDDYLSLSAIFSSFPMKMYRTFLFKKDFGPLREDLPHSEDVIFWAENYGRLNGSVFVTNPDGKEAYVRVVRSGSLSRPCSQDLYSFYVTDRIKLIEDLEKLMVDPSISFNHKKFLVGKIKTHTNFINNYINTLSAPLKAKGREEVYRSKCLFLNKSLFSDRKAIAFCHNFSPWVDASAYVATKRLREIDNLESSVLQWTVVKQNMSKVRPADEKFQMFYADFACSKQISLNGKFLFQPDGQLQYAEDAFNKVKDVAAEVIYSRSLFVGSHMAAYKYKKAYPQVKWYAEFSDPVVYGADNKPRRSLGEIPWQEVERMVYDCADVIIFTNENQRDYMLSYNKFGEKELLRKKAMVLRHPVIDFNYSQIVQAQYIIDDSVVNIGFFGNFYPNRSVDQMLRVLENPKVVLHIFTTKPEELSASLESYGDRVRINKTISYLEVLNLASKMDYLYLNDVQFPGSLNPFLPSKYADYLCTRTPIIAQIQEGSVLSMVAESTVIKVQVMTDQFIASLKKKTKK